MSTVVFLDYGFLTNMTFAGIGWIGSGLSLQKNNTN